MPIAILTLLKFVILALLYWFLYRAVRTVVTDIYGPSRRSKGAPAPRPAVATAAAPKRSRKIPKEIVVHVPDMRPDVVALNGESLVIGRAGASNLVIDDVYVSDEHAEILRDDGGWSVRDLGSTNGTYLNGAKVTKSTPLAAGDQVRVGKTRIEVRR